MTEAEYCTIIKNSLEHITEVGYKIPDPTNSFNTTIKRPFDMIGSFKGKALYIEVKAMNGLHSFNLKKIQDHQIQNLLLYHTHVTDSLCWIALGCYISRGDNRLYIFNNIDIIAERRNNKKNILKKELEKLPYYEIHNKRIDLTIDNFISLI